MTTPTATVALPFEVEFYGATYAAGTNIVVSSNGNIQFTGNQPAATDPGPDCLPEDEFGATLFALFADFEAAGASEGVFTQLYGTAPNRWFVIEWRTSFADDNNQQANFEIVLWDNTDLVRDIYGGIEAPPNNTRALAGASRAGPGASPSSSAREASTEPFRPSGRTSTTSSASSSSAPRTTRSTRAPGRPPSPSTGRAPRRVRSRFGTPRPRGRRPQGPTTPMSPGC